MKVIKRDGREVEYDRNKIAIAIEKANDGVDARERISEDKIYNITEEVRSINSEAFYQCEYIEKIIQTQFDIKFHTVPEDKM